MRRPTAVLALLLAVVVPQAAFAITSEDTMADWLRASDAERSDLLDALQAKTPRAGHASRSEVVDCMNSAAKVAGHGTLRIAEMAQACSEPMKPGDATPGQTEI